jgi:phage terminase large subunit-like protein
MSLDFTDIRNKFQLLNKLEKADFLSKLSQRSYDFLRFQTDIMLRDNQIVSPGDWRYWLFVGGRGTGKSFTGATEIRKRVYAGQHGLCVIAPTHQDLIKIVIPAIIKEFPDDHKPIYVGGDKQIIKCHNGITIDCRTSQQGEIRGPNYTFVWIDELVNCWDHLPEKVEKMFAILDASIRKGGAQILITTTGDRWSIFRKWYDMYNAKNPLIQIRTGTMKENEYLSPQAVQALYEQYGKSRYEDLELNGIINFDVEGALWTPALIKNTRRNSIEEVANPPNPNNMRRYNNPMDFFIKFVIGADPATTSHSNSDAWGLVVAGLGRDHHVYILEDKSKILSPNDAANEIAKLFTTYRNAQVLAESNQGGEMITYILRTKNPNIQPKLIHAHQNKMTRAQPVVVLWDQNRAHIVGNMKELEQEMCEYTGEEGQKSPNRLDAMVYAAQYLLLEANLKPGQNGWMPNMR